MLSALTFIIFGITGDLSRKKLVPAIFNLWKSKCLPKDFLLVGFGRRELSEQDFHNLISESLPESPASKDFLVVCRYFQGSFDDLKTFLTLKETLKEFEQAFQSPAERIFYYAVSPEFYAMISNRLAKAGLHQNNGTSPRIIIEKPFGHNLASAKELSAQLCGVFNENQIYRIDHFLGKETVQNLLAFRFASGIFEPLWNKEHIEAITITVSEAIGIENRAAYYDQTGAVRDMIQNHCLELLAHITMERPDSLDEEAIRNRRVEALQSYYLKSFFLGQYEGYTDEPGVSPDSRTETFASISISVNNNRWKDIPIVITTGKRLKEKRNEITIQFRTPSQKLFHTSLANAITFRIFPEPGITLRFAAKKPGKKSLLSSEYMSCTYPSKTPYGDYEQLILDCLNHDQTFFIRSDEIEAAWAVLESKLAEIDATQPEIYPPNSFGTRSIYKKDQ